MAKSLEEIIINDQWQSIEIVLSSLKDIVMMNWTERSLFPALVRCNNCGLRYLGFSLKRSLGFPSQLGTLTDIQHPLPPSYHKINPRRKMIRLRNIMYPLILFIYGSQKTKPTYPAYHNKFNNLIQCKIIKSTQLRQWLGKEVGQMNNQISYH